MDWMKIHLHGTASPAGYGCDCCDKAAQDDRDNPMPRLPLPSCNHDSDLSLDLSCNVDKPLTPMAQIESARNQWRKAEEFRLEEFRLEKSWTNLNLFDRSQKGHISMDLEKDVLDEYLGSEKKASPLNPSLRNNQNPSDRTILKIIYKRMHTLMGQT